MNILIILIVPLISFLVSWDSVAAPPPRLVSAPPPHLKQLSAEQLNKRHQLITTDTNTTSIKQIGKQTSVLNWSQSPAQGAKRLQKIFFFRQPPHPDPIPPTFQMDLNSPKITQD